jgi:hypothetical protein
LLSCQSFSQNVTTHNTYNNFQTLSIKFIKPDIAFIKGELISNVLAVNNKTDKKVEFIINVTYPNGWKILNNKEKIYEIKPNDFIFIPIRILPPAVLVGSTKFLFNAFAFTTDGKPLANDFFFASTKKIVKWELNVSPENVTYFRNNENTTNFSYNLYNLGNEKIDLFVTLNNNSKNVFISDTSGKLLTKLYNNYTVEPLKDTTIYLKLKYSDNIRNKQWVDIENHKPLSQTSESRFNLFINSSVPKKSFYVNSPRIGKKLDFVRLPSEKMVSPFGSSVIPLVVDANVYNVLNSSTTTIIDLHGNTILSNKANLVYSTQLGFASNYFTNITKNIPLYLGYFYKKGSIQIGDVPTGVYGMGGSKGIKCDYYITSRNKIGASLTRSNNLLASKNITSIGIFNDYYTRSNIHFSTNYGHSINEINKTNTDILSFGNSFLLFKKHYISISLAGSNSYNINNKKINRFGYSSNLSYSGIFFKNKLNTNANVTNSSSNFGIYNSKSFNLFFNNTLQISKKTKLFFSNSYNEYETGTMFSKVYSNSFSIGNDILKSKTGNFKPLVFYNISDISNYIVHSRGLGLNYSIFKKDNNLNASFSLRTGYNKYLDEVNKRDYFFIQNFFLLKYRTYGINVRYNYGSNSVSKQYYTSLSNKYPQALGLSLQNQYLFKNTRFAIQNNIGYSYYNQFYSNSFNVSSDVFYYTVSGWRFKLNLSCYLSSSNTQKGLKDYYNNINQQQTEAKPTVSSGMNIGFGIRKEFGIPIPSSKIRYANVTIIPFIDVNGNHKMDENENFLDNIVIRIDGWEAITSEKGVATFKNVPVGKYTFMVFPLDDLQGWFANKEDTISIFKKNEIRYIPFVKGVKIYGSILLEREKFAGDIEKPIDLSKIKIVAHDGKSYYTLTNSKGEYEFYLPYGKYTISMDEKILSSQFILMQNDFTITLNEQTENLYIPFYVVEKKRKVNIKKFGNGNEKSENVKPAEEKPAINEAAAVNKVVTKQAVIKKTAAEKLAEQKAAIKKTAAEKATAKKLAAEKAAAEIAAKEAKKNEIMNSADSKVKETQQYLERLKALDEAAKGVNESYKLSAEDKNREIAKTSSNAVNTGDTTAAKKANVLHSEVERLNGKSVIAESVKSRLDDAVKTKQNGTDSINRYASDVKLKIASDSIDASIGIIEKMSNIQKNTNVDTNLIFSDERDKMFIKTKENELNEYSQQSRQIQDEINILKGDYENIKRDADNSRKKDTKEIYLKKAEEVNSDIKINQEKESKVNNKTAKIQNEIDSAKARLNLYSEVANDIKKYNKSSVGSLNKLLNKKSEEPEKQKKQEESKVNNDLKEKEVKKENSENLPIDTAAANKKTIEKINTEKKDNIVQPDLKTKSASDSLNNKTKQGTEELEKQKKQEEDKLFALWENDTKQKENSIIISKDTASVVEDKKAVDAEKIQKFINNSTNPKTVRELFFTIQVGVYMKPDVTKFEALKDVFLEKNDKSYRICSGKFDNFLDASVYKDGLVKRGFEGAHIIAYYKGKKITNKEAKKIYYR